MFDLGSDGNFEDAMDAVVHLRLGVLVVQGSDSGGHCLEQSASVFSLVLEMIY